VYYRSKRYYDIDMPCVGNVKIKIQAVNIDLWVLGYAHTQHNNKITVYDFYIRDSVVGIATVYGLDDQGVGV
jgi:hypothetical protein